MKILVRARGAAALLGYAYVGLTSYSTNLPWPAVLNLVALLNVYQVESSIKYIVFCPFGTLSRSQPPMGGDPNF